MLDQQLVNALSLGCVYALFALGFTLVFGVLGVINLSHGAIFMIGAYAALEVVTRLGFPLWASLVAAFFVASRGGAHRFTLVAHIASPSCASPPKLSPSLLYRLFNVV